MRIEGSVLDIRAHQHRDADGVYRFEVDHLHNTSMLPQRLPAVDGGLTREIWDKMGYTSFIKIYELHEVGLDKFWVKREGK